jgi:hypothetical protein
MLRPVYLGIWGPRPHFCYVSCGFVDVGQPLWREDESVVYNCCWPSLAQSFLGPSPAGLMTIFHCLRFETPPIWRAGSPRNRMAQLYPQALGSVFIALYDSQGYDGGTGTRLHADVCADFNFFRDVYTSPVRTSQATYHVSATKVSLLVLFRETVAVYFENRMKHTNTLRGHNPTFWFVKSAGTYSNHRALKG